MHNLQIPVKQQGKHDSTGPQPRIKIGITKIVRDHKDQAGTQMAHTASKSNEKIVPILSQVTEIS
jgi:hypothetical protein